MRTLFATLSRLIYPYYNIADSLSALSGLAGSIVAAFARAVRAVGSAMAEARATAWEAIKKSMRAVQRFVIPKPKST